MLDLKPYQKLLKRRLTKPLLDLFRELTGLHLQPWWHGPAPEPPTRALLKLCSQPRSRRTGKLLQACEACRRKDWPQKRSDFQPERRFVCRCGLSNFYACLTIQAQPVVTLIVQQPTASSRAGKQRFSRAISLTRLILHDLKGTVESRPAPAAPASLHQGLSTAASDGHILPLPGPQAALRGRRGKGTPTRNGEERIQKPVASPELLASSPSTSAGQAPNGKGAGQAEIDAHLANGNHRQQLVQRMLEFIHANYSHPVQLHDLAAAMNLNASYVSSLFSSTLGETFHHYLQDFRLARAKDLLRDPVKRVSEVAYAVGYSNPNHFRNVKGSTHSLGHFGA